MYTYIHIYIYIYIYIYRALMKLVPFADYVRLFGLIMCGLFVH